MNGLGILFGLVLLTILALVAFAGSGNKPRIRGGYQPIGSDKSPKTPPKNAPNVTSAVKKD